MAMEFIVENFKLCQTQKYCHTVEIYVHHISYFNQVRKIYVRVIPFMTAPFEKMVKQSSLTSCCL